MPLRNETEWEELQRLIKEPLPGGRGFQAAKAKRMEDLRAIVVRDMFEQMNDCEGVRGLFEMYMELLCGKDLSDPRICGTEQFKSLWNDYHPEGDD